MKPTITLLGRIFGSTLTVMNASRGELSDAVNARLQRAVSGSQAVRISRGIAGADVLEGYLTAYSAKWTLLARIADDLSIDGHTAVRTRDIDRVQRHPKHELASRLLTKRGQWPPPSLDPAPPLAGTGAMLRGLAALAPTLTVFVETHDPDVCFIGVPVEWTDRALWLDELSPQGTWEDTTSRWRFTDITRVDVGCRYEAALVEAAGPPPTR